jgi:hypothetical protein
MLSPPQVLLSNLQQIDKISFMKKWIFYFPKFNGGSLLDCLYYVKVALGQSEKFYYRRKVRESELIGADCAAGRAKKTTKKLQELRNWPLSPPAPVAYLSLLFQTLSTRLAAQKHFNAAGYTACN